MARVKKRYADMWDTRRTRYGKTGRIPKGKWMQFRDTIADKMQRNRLARKKLIGSMKKSPKRTALLKKLRSAWRHRPVKKGYWRGDQIRPKTFDKKGWKQFWQTHKIDRDLKGTSQEYGEFWEQDRRKVGNRSVDRVYHEWKALEKGRKKAKAKRKLKRVV
ncbi:MAG: hypothetical protein PVI03_01370 [Candidatus Thorarchaeota archaeon]|jgi:hypothetical protein